MCVEHRQHARDKRFHIGIRGRGQLLVEVFDIDFMLIDIVVNKPRIEFRTGQSFYRRKYGLLLVRNVPWKRD